MVDLSQMFLKPREFLRHNLLVMDTSPSGVCGSQVPVLGNFTIATDARYDNVKRRSKRFWKQDYAVNVLKVSWKGESGNGTVPGIWLPYEANQTRTANLSNDVPFMFTAPLSGCSFALSTYRNGSARVAHANYQTDEGEIDHGRILGGVSGFGKSIHRESYRTTVRGKPAAPERHAGLLMTVIGANDPKRGWKFYGQQYELNLMDGTVEFIELKDLN